MGLKKQIVQFKDGKEIATYNSATEAAEVWESDYDKDYSGVKTLLEEQLK